MSAADLLLRAQTSGAVTYSGYVESNGTLRLPVSDHFSDVPDLFGGRINMRVWWGGKDDWRVDHLSVTGETDLYHDASGTTSWNYEANRAIRTRDAGVRLPRTSDLLPPVLSQRLLGDAHADEVTRLASANVAGVDAPGLRLRPSDEQSSINHVDVWVEPASGLPLKVAIFATGADVAALTTTFVDVSVEPPSATATSFTLPRGADIRFEDVVDIEAAANRYAPIGAPMQLAGMSRHDTGRGAVGVYGRGVTELLAIPLWQPAADPLRAQLAVTPGASITDIGTTLGVGPLNLLLTKPAFAGHSWLLVGTVTSRTLVGAAEELRSAPLRTRAGELLGVGRN